jgi:SAM-dependent methyltransferase
MRLCEVVHPPQRSTRETLAVTDVGPLHSGVSAHAAFPGRAELPLDTVTWGPGVPGDDVLRLLGTPSGKRVLLLGIGLGHNAVALARAGARVIAVDEDVERIDAARQLAETHETKIEVHQGDPADLAFIRADTIDTAIAVFTLGRVDDLDRTLRQVNRVLRTSGGLVASFPHPISLAVEPESFAGPRIIRRYGDQQPLPLGDLRIHSRSIAEIFAAFHRANFRIDALLEPMGDTALLPGTLLVRGKKDGV